MSFFARLAGWIVMWVIVLALFGFYIWLLDLVFDVGLADTKSASGRDALIAIGSLMASFATINGLMGAVKWHRHQDQGRPGPVHAPNANERRAKLQPDESDRVRKYAAILFGSLFVALLLYLAGSTLVDALR